MPLAQAEQLNMGSYEGIVSSVSLARITIKNGDVFIECPAAGEVMASLVVGDRVRYEATDEVFAFVEMLPRTNYIARLRGDRSRRSRAGYEEHVLVANVDLAVIVASAMTPAFHPRFIDRYLIACQSGGVSPAICMNKIDLVAIPPSLTMYDGLAIPVVYASAAAGAGLEDLKAVLRGKTTVLVGTSGVGKSSLINMLIPDRHIKEGVVSAKSGVGRHTTTATSLYTWEPGSIIIDTPGIRSLGLENLEKETLKDYFPEFDQYAPDCKFRNCSHLHEPHCSVKTAVEDSLIAAARYESYTRLMAE